MTPVTVRHGRSFGNGLEAIGEGHPGRRIGDGRVQEIDRSGTPRWGDALRVRQRQRGMVVIGVGADGKFVGPDIAVAVFDDRMEIASLESLPAGVTAEMFPSARQFS
jgi:hypothetical protein